MTKDTCATCKFWVKTGPEPVSSGDKLLCRRFPPSMDHKVGVSLFPAVYASYWCGEHQERPAETLADAIEAGCGDRLVPRYEAAALWEGQAYIDGGRVQLTPAEVAIIRERMGRGK